MKINKKISIESSEQETHITFDSASKIAKIFTVDPVYIRRLDKLVEEYPGVYKLDHLEDWCGNKVCYYTVPSKFISFRKPIVRIITEEQRKAAAERMATMRANKNKK